MAQLLDFSNSHPYNAIASTPVTREISNNHPMSLANTLEKRFRIATLLYHDSREDVLQLNG